MNTLFLILLSIIGYILAYRLYGRFIASKIFNLSDKNIVPSHEFKDNIDFVPTKKNIIFGHHFTTIAGLGPIVGPAIGIIWGWLPAFLWVFFGSIFMGAVHDFSTLVISGRTKGKSIGDLTGNLLSSSTRYAFQFIMQFLLFIVLAVFAMIVGVLFKMYPESVIPVWFQLPIAVWLGWQIRKGKNDFLYSVIAVVLLYLSILLGVQFPLRIPPIMGSEVVTWCVVLFIYVFFASTIPVHKLLQPRDYINSHQLFVATFLLLLGIIIAHPPVTAPAINPEAFKAGTDIPNLMPLLFITVACGAISGFHSLASSGTTVKQVDNEKDMLFVGYGSMLVESLLAVLVLMAIAGGLGMGLEKDGIMFKGIEAFRHHYSSWSSASGLEANLEAFVVGSANLLNSYGIPASFGKALIAVFIVSFANTTLDSATRIQRLSLQEIFRTSFKIKEIQKDKKNKLYIFLLKLFNYIKKQFIYNRYISTAFVVIAAGLMTFAKPGAKGALVLWPLFGSLNQLLAALALLIVTVYLYFKKKNILVAFIPMLLILIVTLWAMVQNVIKFLNQKEILLLIISIIILVLTIWLLISSISALINKKHIKREN
ncbi:MAG: carbon starvation protein A [Bacteroidales bacterium]|nr:carbon starvation protein A [Bacteroidales bacterium]